MKKLSLNHDGLLVFDDVTSNYVDHQRKDEELRDFILRITSKEFKREKMTPKQNIGLAKRALVDNIYKAAKLENIAVTYAATIEIVEQGKNSGNLTPAELTDVVNLKRSWNFLLDENTLKRLLDIDLLKEIHTKVAFGMANLELAEIGNFRTGLVATGGTVWRPKIPNTEEIYQEMQTIINDYPDVLRRAIKLYLWICKRQAFRDGNKRTANYFANFELIKHGAGILSPPPEEALSEFRTLLIDYYETADEQPITAFLLNKCYSFDAEGLPIIYQKLQNK